MSDKRPAASDPLTEVKTEYERFCEEHGGAVRPAQNYAEVELSLPCSDHPYRRFAEIIQKWQADELTGMLHWPRMAYAVSEFAYRSKLESEIHEELQPAQVKVLLREIQLAAKTFRMALRHLEQQGLRVHDPAAPLKSEHLAWLDAFIAQVAAGNFSDKVDEHPKQMAHTQFGRRDFLKRLIQIEAAAKQTQNRVDFKKLRRKPGPQTSALTMFVSRVASIWESLTTEKAIAYSVGGQSTEDTPFVQFVGELAKIAGEAPPSWKQVNAALRSYPPS